MKKNIQFVFTAMLILMVCSCSGKGVEEETGFVKLVKVSELELKSEENVVGELLGELIDSEEDGYLFGVDLRARMAYRISTETGEAQSLAPEGRGPNELSLPVQLAIGDDKIKIIDTSQDVVAIYDGNSIVEKYSAYGQHGVWPRGYAAYITNGELITSIEDQEHVQSMNFDEARPLAILNFRNGDIRKAGRFSSTIDDIDSESKYPVIYLDRDEEAIYYMLRTDYTLMQYDLKNDETEELVSQKHSLYRERTHSGMSGRPASAEGAKELGMSMSQLIGINRVGDRLIVIWQNYNEGFYNNHGDDSPGNVDYFGLSYDIKNYENSEEFELPGRFLGVYRNQLIVEENMSDPDLSIGFYTFQD